MKDSLKDLIRDNKCLKEQKAVAKIVLRPEQSKIIENCLDTVFLEGMRVGLEEGKKIYK